MTYYFGEESLELKAKVTRYRLEEVENKMILNLENLEKSLELKDIESTINHLLEYGELIKKEFKYEHLSIIVEELSLMFEMKEKKIFQHSDLAKLKANFIFLIHSVKNWRETYQPKDDDYYINNDFYRYYITIKKIFEFKG